MKRGAVAAVLLTLLLAFGVAADSPKKARKAYLEAYEAYTQHLIVYWDFQTALNVRGTYLTPEFRTAMAEERQRLLGAPEEDHRKFLARLQDDGETYHEVVFSADSGMEAGDAFGTTDDGWIVRLIADGTEEKLVTLYRVRKPNALQRALYPHFNQWSRLWIARFERSVTEPDVVVVHFGSGYGNGELRFEDLRD